MIVYQPDWPWGMGVCRRIPGRQRFPAVGWYLLRLYEREVAAAAALTFDETPATLPMFHEGFDDLDAWTMSVACSPTLHVEEELAESGTGERAQKAQQVVKEELQAEERARSRSPRMARVGMPKGLRE